MRVLAVCLMVVLTGCATQRGNERHAQHAADQIRMVAIQREAMVQEAQADAQTNTALVEALAEVARSNPDHAPAVTVALAVIGVSGQSGGASQGNGSSGVVTLQRQQNEALEWTKALAPTVGNLVSGLGVAAINASVTKNAQDANRAIMLGDQEQNARIVEAVAGLGTAASNNSGITAGGDVYQVSDSGVIDQSMNTTDSYNTASTFTLSTTLNYDGSSMTLAELIQSLRDAGATYSIDLDGDGTIDVTGDGDGEEVALVCSGFSPQPLECT